MIKLSTISAEQIEERGLLTREPKWMRQERLKAWKQFQEMEYPNWTRSKIPKVDLAASTQLEFPRVEFAPLPLEKKPPAGAAGKITLADGKLVRISLLPELAHKGVIFSDLQTAVLERADLLEPYWLQSFWGVEDKFTAFHRALWNNGYFLYVPKGVVIDLPIQIQVLQKNPVSILDRSLIILDQQAGVTIEERYESEGDSDQTLVCATATEAFVGEGARFQYFSVQNWGPQVYDLSYRRINGMKNSHSRCLFAMLGAKAGRVAITGKVEGDGAYLEHDGILVGGDNQRFKLIAELDHRGKHTDGLMRYKGILKDASYSDLDGLIRVGRNAAKSNSRLEEHTLLLSDKARCDALPALDIETNDVQVSHSASVSQADSERMFYLMSRGLSEDQARQLLVEGFFENILQVIQNPAWYEQIKELIEAKLTQTHLI